jgi:hypothetical protein
LQAVGASTNLAAFEALLQKVYDVGITSINDIEWLVLAASDVADEEKPMQLVCACAYVLVFCSVEHTHYSTILSLLQEELQDIDAPPAYSTGPETKQIAVPPLFYAWLESELKSSDDGVRTSAAAADTLYRLSQLLHDTKSLYPTGGGLDMPVDVTIVWKRLVLMYQEVLEAVIALAATLQADLLREDLSADNWMTKLDVASALSVFQNVLLTECNFILLQERISNRVTAMHVEFDVLCALLLQRTPLNVTALSKFREEAQQRGAGHLMAFEDALCAKLQEEVTTIGERVRDLTENVGIASALHSHCKYLNVCATLVNFLPEENPQYKRLCSNVKIARQQAIRKAEMIMTSSERIAKGCNFVLAERNVCAVKAIADEFEEKWPKAVAKLSKALTLARKSIDAEMHVFVSKFMRPCAVLTTQEQPDLSKRGTLLGVKDGAFVLTFKAKNPFSKSSSGRNYANVTSGMGSALTSVTYKSSKVVTASHHMEEGLLTYIKYSAGICHSVNLTEKDLGTLKHQAPQLLVDGHRVRFLSVIELVALVQVAKFAHVRLDFGVLKFSELVKVAANLEKASSIFPAHAEVYDDLRTAIIMELQAFALSAEHFDVRQQRDVHKALSQALPYLPVNWRAPVEEAIRWLEQKAQKAEAESNRVLAQITALDVNDAISKMSNYTCSSQWYNAQQVKLGIDRLHREKARSIFGVLHRPGSISTSTLSLVHLFFTTAVSFRLEIQKTRPIYNWLFNFTFRSHYHELVSQLEVDRVIAGILAEVGRKIADSLQSLAWLKRSDRGTSLESISGALDLMAHLYDASLQDFVIALEAQHGPLDTFKQLEVFAKDWQALQQDLLATLKKCDVKVSLCTAQPAF